MLCWQQRAFHQLSPSLISRLLRQQEPEFAAHRAGQYTPTGTLFGFWRWPVLMVRQNWNRWRPQGVLEGASCHSLSHSRFTLQLVQPATTKTIHIIRIYPWHNGIFDIWCCCFKIQVMEWSIWYFWHFIKHQEGTLSLSLCVFFLSLLCMLKFDDIVTISRGF